MKLKKLPSLRESKRYLFFSAISDNSLQYPNVKGAIWHSMENWLGQSELAKASPRLIKNLWDSKAGKGVLQCHPKYVNQVKMSLALIKQIGDQRVIFSVERVSGTIKSGKEKTRDTGQNNDKKSEKKNNK